MADKQLEKIVQELEERFGRWEYLKEFGGSDPNWEDGVNMNIVRGHIINCRKKIKELCENTNLPLPDICNREVPQQVRNEYMANPQKIREGAAKSLEIYENDANFNELERVYSEISDKNKKQIASNILGYREGLRLYIEKDSLVDMRRHLNYKMYLESAKRFMAQLKESELSNQISIWSIVR